MLGRLAIATRVAVSAFRRSIEAGGHGRRWPAGSMLRAPAREAHARREVAAGRATWLATNSPHAAALVGAWVSNLVGDGPSVRPLTPDPELRRSLTGAWARWWSDADAEGVVDLGGFLARAARSLIVEGEAFVHLEADPASGALRLRLWAPRQVDASLTREIGDGRRIVAGVELDAAGRRVAYHVRDDLDAILPLSLTTRRVPAEDVAHVFDPIFPGQVRGLSWLAPVATRLAEVDSLEDAMLARQRVAALFGVILTNADGVLPPDMGHGGDAAGTMQASLEPGAILQVPPGFSADFAEPPSTDGAHAFLKSMQRSAAAGAGLPYELLSGDLSGVNYSSARLGLLEFRRRVVAVQKNLLVAQLLSKVWRRFVALETLAGRQSSAALGVDASFIFPGWVHLDPVKETNADISAINARLKSRAEVVAARGRDVEEVDAEIAADPMRSAAA